MITVTTRCDRPGCTRAVTALVASTGSGSASVLPQFAQAAYNVDPVCYVHRSTTR